MTLRGIRAVAAAFVASLGLVLWTGAAAQPVSQDAIRKAFAEADVNKDGVVNFDEYTANVIYVFKQIDRNGDRFITEQEVMTYSPNYNPATFKAADRNGDGKLSVGEVVAAKVIDFFEIDTNRDGVLSIEEVLMFERVVSAAAARK